MSGSIKLRRKRRTVRSAKQRAEDSSARRRDVLRLARLKAEAERAAAPKCGARRRGGGTCQNRPAPGHAVCRRHGAATPRGEQWHRIQWPADPVKRAKKAREIERRRERQAARVAAMTSERRAQYEKRKLAMTPGSKTRRETIKRDQQARLLFEATERRSKPASSEAAALAAEIAALQARRAALLAPLEERISDV